MSPRPSTLPRASPDPDLVGPVWVRTPALMRGYLGRDDLTRNAIRQGWLQTGDLGRLDQTGRLHLRGRERDEINRGGFEVYPGDIETVVEQFDRALDCCAFGHDGGAGEERSRSPWC